jgi:hypothetical protein
MPTTAVTGLPGPQTERLAQLRCVRKSGQNALYKTQGCIIDGTKSRDASNTGYLDVLQPGKVMGKITTGGKYAPSILGVTTVAYADNDTTLTVGAATAVEIARRIGSSGTATMKIVGPPSAAGTVASADITFSAVNQTTGVITLTDLNAAFVAGSFIMPKDGSETPVGLIDDGSGIKVTDDLGVSQDQSYGHLLIGGDLDSSQIIDWPSDSSLVTWLKGQLNVTGNSNFTFDDAM